jgi:hypothetical protein
LSVSESYSEVYIANFYLLLSSITTSISITASSVVGFEIGKGNLYAA